MSQPPQNVGTLLHHTAPCCTSLHFALFSLEVVKPSGDERWWAPDQHPMCPCGCSPRIDQVRSLAASAQAQFRSHSTMLHFFAAPSCTLLHHPAPHCTLLHHTALLTSHVEVVFYLVRSNSFPLQVKPMVKRSFFFVLTNCTLLHFTAPPCTTLHHTALYVVFAGGGEALRW